MRKLHTLARKSGSLFVLLALLGITAHAAPILLFTSRDTFNAALGRPDLFFNLNDLGDQSMPAFNLGALLIEQIGSGEIALQAGAFNLSLGPGDVVAFNFSREVFAWGAEFVTIGAAGNMKITAGSESRAFQPEGFVGFVTAPGSAFNFSLDDTTRGPQISFLMDNIVAHSVPEPATLTLLAAGIGLIGLAHRRRKHQKQAGKGLHHPGAD